MSVVLQDGDLKLRAIEPRDKDALAKNANNKKIWDNLRDYMPYPYTVKDAVYFIELTAKENPKVTFGIDYQGELCGVCGLIPQQDVYRKTAEIGYWLGEDYWGKGIASRAVKLLVPYGLNTLGFVRLQTGVFAHNLASMKVLEKNGFVKEAIFKNAVIKNGSVLDEHKFAIWQ